MKYSIHIRSDKNPYLCHNHEYMDKTISVEAKDYCDAVGFAMSEACEDKIPNSYLPLRITIQASA